MRRLRWVVPFIWLVCLGCSERSNEIASPVVKKTPDMTFEDSGVITRFYDAGNRYTQQVLADLAAKPEVRSEIERFQAMGYVLRPLHSFVTEGSAADGRHVEIAIFSLANGYPEDRDAVHLVCVSGPRGLHVVPVALAAEAPGTDTEYEPVGKDVWLGVIEPLRVPGTGDSGPAIEWNWRRFGRCAGAAALAGATSCLFSCRIVLAGYFKCVAVCSAGRALGGLVGCAFAELF